MVLELVYYLNRNFICRSENVESKNFFPAWLHAVWFLDDLGMFDLVLPSTHLLIDHNLYHRLKAVGIEKFVIELSIDYVES